MKKKIGARILAALEIRDMTQKELAYRTGITAVSISRYCSGQRTPNLENAYKIAQVLNVDINYLIGLTKGVRV